MPDQSPLKIKYYDNRKLYNTETARYVKWRDVVDYIQQGRPVEVREFKNGVWGKDITHRGLQKWASEKFKDAVESLGITELKKIVCELNLDEPNGFRLHEVRKKAKAYTIHELRAAFGMEPVLKKKRKCLSCGVLFISHTKAQRICPNCKKSRSPWITYQNSVLHPRSTAIINSYAV